MLSLNSTDFILRILHPNIVMSSSRGNFKNSQTVKADIQWNFLTTLRCQIWSCVYLAELFGTFKNIAYITTFMHEFKPMNSFVNVTKMLNRKALPYKGRSDSLQ